LRKDVVRVRSGITLTRKRLQVEAAGAAVVAASISIAVLHHDWCERLCHWLMRYERYEADELVLVTVVFAALFIVLLFRRETQLRSEMRSHQSAQREAHRSARHDYLTGLPNRLAFAEAFPDRIGATAILLIDLDGFKTINDSQGHAVGDEVLRVVAARLEAVVSGDAPGLVARMGGDEFSCILRPAPTERDLAVLGRQIVDAVSEPILLGSMELRVTPSVGIACSGDGPFDRDELLHRADRSMYLAKRAGVGQVSLFGCASAGPGAESPTIDNATFVSGHRHDPRGWSSL
jgi:diguanylate cyclase (GGDEF)-like protein